MSYKVIVVQILLIGLTVLMDKFVEAAGFGFKETFKNVAPVIVDALDTLDSIGQGRITPCEYKCAYGWL